MCYTICILSAGSPCVKLEEEKASVFAVSLERQYVREALWKCETLANVIGDKYMRTGKKALLKDTCYSCNCVNLSVQKSSKGCATKQF